MSKRDFKEAFAMDQTSPNFKECQTKHLEIDVSLAERRRKIPFSKALHGVMNDRILGVKVHNAGLFETSVK